MATNNLEMFANMGILLWNVKRVQHPDFKKLTLELISREKGKILILTKTHADGHKAKQIANSFPLTNVEMTSTIRFARGTWLLWNEAEVDAQVVNRSE